MILQNDLNPLAPCYLQHDIVQIDSAFCFACGSFEVLGNTRLCNQLTAPAKWTFYVWTQLFCLMLLFLDYYWFSVRVLLPLDGNSPSIPRYDCKNILLLNPAAKAGHLEWTRWYKKKSAIGSVIYGWRVDMQHDSCSVSLSLHDSGEADVRVFRIGRQRCSVSFTKNWLFYKLNQNE
jgi:hypothetical protein